MQRMYTVPPSTYFGLGLFATGLAFITLVTPALFAWPPDPMPQMIIILSIAAAIPCVTLWSLSRFKIVLTPDRLIYSSAFNKTHSINLKDITHSHIIFRYGRVGSQPLLKIESADATFTINFKVFSREACQDLFQTVKAKN